MNLKKFAVILTSIGALCASSYAFAARYYSHHDYYSDATYSQKVGTRIAACNGQVYLSGTMTTYSVLIDRFNCTL